MFSGLVCFKKVTLTSLLHLFSTKEFGSCFVLLITLLTVLVCVRSRKPWRYFLNAHFKKVIDFQFHYLNHIQVLRVCLFEQSVWAKSQIQTFNWLIKSINYVSKTVCIFSNCWLHSHLFHNSSFYPSDKLASISQACSSTANVFHCDGE